MKPTGVYTRKTFILIAFFCLLLGFAHNSIAQKLNKTSIDFELITGGLTEPISIKNAADSSNRLFLVNQRGDVLIYDGTQLLPAPFLDIQAKTNSGSERGLLDIEFHPNYSTNGFFFIHYTDLGGNTVIARYTVSAADPNVADPASEQIILTQSQPAPNHNGGQMEFGPDGFLYIALGDGGISGNNPANPAQNLSSILGKILRIDVNGPLPYAIPASNPFVGTPGAREEIWAYGLRNPWRMSFDRQTGDLFIADVGQNRFEEVNFQPAASTGGENYGWPLMEANACFNPSTNCNNGSLVLPILEYDHSVGDCSITGGYSHRGNLYPHLDGIYFYGDFCTGNIQGAERDSSGNWTTRNLLDTSNFNLSSWGEDEAGNIYMVGRGNGQLFRLNQTNTPAEHNDFDGASQSDILFIQDSGVIANGLLVDSVLQTFSEVIQIDPTLGYSLNSTSDFNGDRKADLLLYDSTNGAYRTVTLNGSAVLTDTVPFGLDPALGFLPFGTGDFNGDGRDEVIVHDPVAGLVLFIFLDAAGALSSVEFVTQVDIAGNWTLHGTGDFNSDGKTDLLQYNTVTGATLFNEMDGSTVNNTVGLLALDPAAGWALEETGDFDGNGSSDLAFVLNGSLIAVITLENSAVNGFFIPGAVPADNEIVNAGRYSADNKDDFLFRNTVTGEVQTAIQDGTTITSTNSVLTLAPATGWNVHSGKP